MNLSQSLTKALWFYNQGRKVVESRSRMSATSESLINWPTKTTRKVRTTPVPTNEACLSNSLISSRLSTQVEKLMILVTFPQAAQDQAPQTAAEIFKWILR